jgi:hypothetical protein
VTKRYQRTIIAIRGDTQGGQAVGLLNPETQIPDVEIDENDELKVSWRTPELRPVQRKLWEWHEGWRKDIQKLADGDPITFIEMGDMTQGNVFKDDMAEISLSGQYFISKWSMVPWMEMPEVKRVYITKGTGVHVWGEGATETMLTHFLKVLYPKKKIEITNHWLLNVDGFTMDVAHHGPGAGIRNWTRGNAFELYAKSVMMDEIDLGQPVPNILLRGHKHEFIYRRAIHQVKDKIWDMLCMITPPMCFIDSYATKVVNSPSSMGVGMLALEIINGQLYKWHPFTHFVDLRTREIV